MDVSIVTEQCIIISSSLLNAWYRKRPKLDRDSEADDVTVKTELLIPGLDLVDDADISAVKEEDILDTGAIYIVSVLHGILKVTLVHTHRHHINGYIPSIPGLVCCPTHNFTSTFAAKLCILSYSPKRFISSLKPGLVTDHHIFV